VSDSTASDKAERYVRPLTAESQGTAPGRGRLNGRRVLVVGGGQRAFLMPRPIRSVTAER
jgi:hypothetical protein